VSISPVPVEFTEIPGTANGYFSRDENKIAVRDDLSQSHTLKTLIHEITHATLHAENTDKKRNIEEIEAESVAYVVAHHLGIDSSDYSFGYVAAWSREKTTAELQEHLENIHKCAVKIIDQLDKTLEKTEKAIFSANDIKNITEIDTEVKEKNEQEIGKGE
jgi:Zn-dependent peptidase ImmA (M78 family)